MIKLTVLSGSFNLWLCFPINLFWFEFDSRYLYCICGNTTSFSLNIISSADHRTIYKINPISIQLTTKRIKVHTSSCYYNIIMVFLLGWSDDAVTNITTDHHYHFHNAKC